MSLFRELARHVDSGIEADGRWLICESAIVAVNQDDESRGRIKVVIPSIDADYIFDDWAVPAATHCMGDGFGMLMIPPKGAEVLVTGVLGQKFNLIYHAAVYNESMKVPAELDIDTSGIKVPKGLSFIAGLLLKLVGQNIQIIANQLARMTGATAEVVATGEAKITGGTVRIESDGTITVTGGTVNVSSNGNIAVNASGNLTLQGRTVNKVGPPI